MDLNLRSAKYKLSMLHGKISIKTGNEEIYVKKILGPVVQN